MPDAITLKDPRHLVAMEPIETRWRFTARDTILYALGVGAHELPFVYEDGLRALPSMPVIMAYPGFIWRDPALGVDWRRVLHGESTVTIHAPLPVDGELIGQTRFGPVYDKGADKGAVVCQTREIRTVDGTLVATVGSTSMLRGNGGFGDDGEVQPPPHPIPDRAPDCEHAITTSPEQAMIYRLSGDMNPLHIDPAAARDGGFDRPILHGQCTFGVAVRALMAMVCDNDPARVRSVSVRFSRLVYPGDTIRTQVWREADGRFTFRALCAERDEVVLTNGVLTVS